MPPLYESNLPHLNLLFRGKVRDIYDLGEELLLVATDRISAFDVIFNEPVPGKGEILTQLSLFWFDKMREIVPNHLSPRPVGSLFKTEDEKRLYEGRSMLVKKMRPLAVEAIVRGYIIGSGWKDYQATGSVCGIRLSKGLRQGERLPEPIFTPSTKAAGGTHDENITFEQASEVVERGLLESVRETSLKLYKKGASYAESRGIIMADTKFEFGTDGDGRLVLIDELMTPDSSRFWPKDGYEVGVSPPSFDKQFVRDWLIKINWDKTPPPPKLPPEIIEKTAAKYREALERLTGYTERHNF